MGLVLICFMFVGYLNLTALGAWACGLVDCVGLPILDVLIVFCGRFGG